MKEERSVLFVCSGNTCRSQMAEAIARSLISDVHFFSAGTKAVKDLPINPYAVTVLNESGIMADHQKSKPLSSIDLSAIDVIILLTEQPMNIPYNYLHWPIADPFGSEPGGIQLPRYRAVREELLARISQFKQTLFP